MDWSEWEATRDRVLAATADARAAASAYRAAGYPEAAEWIATALALAARDARGERAEWALLPR